MLSLTKGIYLGTIEKSICDDDIIACLTSYNEAESYKKMHCHENPHISFVLAGGNLEKRKNGQIERLPGKITFYYSGENHQSIDILNFSKHINLELKQRFITEYRINEGTLAYAIAKNPDAKFLLLRIYKELTTDDEISAISIRMLLLELLNHSMYFQEKEKNHSWVNIVDEILRNNLYQQWSLNYLSTIVQMHPVTVSRQFHKYYSCTLGEYVRKLKIEKALTLIKTSQNSLTEIAFECGFADQSHFIRTFKRLTGLLPHIYQKM